MHVVLHFSNGFKQSKGSSWKNFSVWWYVYVAEIFTGFSELLKYETKRGPISCTLYVHVLKQILHIHWTFIFHFLLKPRTNLWDR